MKIPRLAWVFAFILASALHAALFVFIANAGKAINLEQNFGGFDYQIKNDQILKNPPYHNLKKKQWSKKKKRKSLR